MLVFSELTAIFHVGSSGPSFQVFQLVSSITSQKDFSHPHAAKSWLWLFIKEFCSVCETENRTKEST